MMGVWIAYSDSSSIDCNWWNVKYKTWPTHSCLSCLIKNLNHEFNIKTKTAPIMLTDKLYETQQINVIYLNGRNGVTWSILSTRQFKNINWRYVQSTNVVNNVDMLSLRAPWQNGPYKNQHTERHTNTHNTMTQQTFRKKLHVCVFRIFLFFFFFFIISLINSSRNVEIPSWYGQWLPLGV